MSGSYPFPWGPPPPGYVPGVGRGAVGFINSIEAGVVDIESPGFGTGNQSAKYVQQIQEADEKADKFYKDIDEQMKNRNAKRKEELINENQSRFEKIRDQFADLREDLGTIDANAWENLPEIGATTYHRPKWDLYTHASDRMINNDFEDSALNKEIQEEEELRNLALISENQKVDADTEILSVSRAQKSVLNVALSKVLPKQSALDVSKFLQELDHKSSEIINQYKDLNRASIVYRQLTHSNPTNEQGWLVRARIEEKKGCFDKARKVARDGYLNCPQSELLVMEAARLSPHQDAINIILSALKAIHRNSEKLWLQLIAIQSNEIAKKSVLEDALQVLPKSEVLWQAAAAFEEPGEKHTTILKKALELLPEKEELWIEGIKSSTTEEDSFYFINGAKAKVGCSIRLYVAWSQMEELYHEGARCIEICQEAIQAFPNHDWTEEAQLSEQELYIVTAISIINSIPYSEKLIEKASLSERRGFYETARALYLKYSVFNNSYYSYLQFEKNHGNIEETVASLLEKKLNNENLIIDLLDVLDESRSIDILMDAYNSNPTSEKIVLSLIDSLINIKNIDYAKQIAEEASKNINSATIYLKYASIIQQYGGDIQIYQKGVELYPDQPKLWILLSELSNDPFCVIKEAVKECPKSPEIYIEMIKLAKANKMARPRVRALFEHARRNCPTDAKIWLLSAEHERPENKITMLEDAKAVVRDKGIIWMRQLELNDPEGRITLVKEAINGNGPLKELVLVSALCLWRSGSLDLAKSTFQNISHENPNWVDGWLFRIKFEKMYGNPEEASKLMESIDNSHLKNGFIWQANRDNPENFGLSNLELFSSLIDLVPDPMSSDASVFGCILEI